MLWQNSFHFLVLIYTYIIQTEQTNVNEQNHLSNCNYVFCLLEALPHGGAPHGIRNLRHLIKKAAVTPVKNACKRTNMLQLLLIFILFLPNFPSI
jgi:hypothetical protein